MSRLQVPGDVGDVIKAFICFRVFQSVLSLKQGEIEKLFKLMILGEG